jgi:predicted metal-dependent phosphoesterase TrpH
MDVTGTGVPPLTGLADLHVHSTASDGTLPPAEVVRRAHAAGLAAMALTDHDTVAGVAEAQAEGNRLGVRVVSGCEFSVRVAWGEMHLLGYFLPVTDPVIERFLEGERAMRLDRAHRMVESLQAWGVDIAPEDVLAEAGNAAVGRPHVARALVRLGKVRDVPAAFDEFLGQGRRAYVEKTLPSLAEVADLVHRAGGVVSAAHLRDRANRATLQLLKADGLDAVEVRHPRHSAELRGQIEESARQLGLLPTGGTDWHGPGHDEGLLPLGTDAVPMEWLSALEARAAGRQS